MAIVFCILGICGGAWIENRGYSFQMRIRMYISLYHQFFALIWFSVMASDEGQISKISYIFPRPFTCNLYKNVIDSLHLSVLKFPSSYFQAWQLFLIYHMPRLLRQPCFSPTFGDHSSSFLLLLRSHSLYLTWYSTSYSPTEFAIAKIIMDGKSQCSVTTQRGVHCEVENRMDKSVLCLDKWRELWVCMNDME